MQLIDVGNLEFKCKEYIRTKTHSNRYVAAITDNAQSMTLIVIQSWRPLILTGCLRGH